jgi:hypothetical protein
MHCAFSVGWIHANTLPEHKLVCSAHSPLCWKHSSLLAAPLPVWMLSFSTNCSLVCSATSSAVCYLFGHTLRPKKHLMHIKWSLYNSCSLVDKNHWNIPSLIWKWTFSHAEFIRQWWKNQTGEWHSTWEREKNQKLWPKKNVICMVF